MKKCILILGLFLSLVANAQADVCYHINETVAKKAVGIIKIQKEIYQYCSICADAEPQTLEVHDIKDNNPIYVNGIALDLAHTYYKQNNKFVNLGIASGCIEAGEYNIAAELDDLPTIHRTKERDKEQAHAKTQEIFEKCVNNAKINDNVTTADMIRQNTEINDCLENAIKAEIKKGFNAEQQEKMLEYVKQIREVALKFYFGVYTENKYCYGVCGSMTNILPYSDEGKILADILERLIYLNISKNGY
ncbi:MAG: hypothetical protein IJ099_05065 [Alphaproteobacteria bacterium]|nr:hypothetical protein [Alphaproteobacteria bacterium]